MGSDLVRSKLVVGKQQGVASAPHSLESQPEDLLQHKRMPVLRHDVSVCSKVCGRVAQGVAILAVRIGFPSCRDLLPESSLLDSLHDDVSVGLI